MYVRTSWPTNDASGVYTTTPLDSNRRREDDGTTLALPRNAPLTSRSVSAVPMSLSSTEIDTETPCPVVTVSGQA